MAGLEAAITYLDESGVPAEVWVDGSFLTEKIEPDDVDVVLRYDGDQYDHASPEFRQAIDSFRNGQWWQYHCHTYHFAVYPRSEDHDLIDQGKDDERTWKKRFGVSRGNNELGDKTHKNGVGKGIVNYTQGQALRLLSSSQDACRGKSDTYSESI